MEQNGSCLIMCAGDLTVSEIIVEKNDILIAADGGYDYCKLLELTPDIIIGDFDSIAEESEAEITKDSNNAVVYKLPREKDDTDTLAAIRIGLEKGYKVFKIYAACGGRLEHTIANIQCLLFLKSQGATGYICDGTGMIFAIENEEVSFRESMEGYLSLFCMGKKAKGVSIKGLKYTMDNGEMSNTFPIGISNEFIGKKAMVSVEDGTLIGIITY